MYVYYIIDRKKEIIIKYVECRGGFWVNCRSGGFIEFLWKLY